MNIRKVKPVIVQGVAGTREINTAGDLVIKVVARDQLARTIMVKDVLFDPDSPVNLISADQLRRSGYSIRLEENDKDCCIVLNANSSEPIHYALRCEHQIFSLYLVEENEVEVTFDIDSEQISKAMSLFSGNISLEELMHLRMNHANDDKLVKQSSRVDGIKCQLKCMKMYKGACHCCQDAKATRNDYPPAAETWAD